LQTILLSLVVAVALCLVVAVVLAVIAQHQQLL
jgi:hypothetical protein